jgi:hypothetical protein
VGRIAKVLSFFRTLRNGAQLTDVKINTGGNVTKTCENFSSSGDDSQPLNTDYCAILDIERSGGSVVVGYVDPKNAGVTSAGEKRIYSRDGSGNIAAFIHLKSNGNISIENDVFDIRFDNDGFALINNTSCSIEMNSVGAIKLTNSIGAIELRSDGVIDINGFTFAPGGVGGGAGQSISADSVVVNGKELDGHVHSGVTTGGSNTGPIP